MNRTKIKHMAMIDLIGALTLERPLNEEEYSIIRSFSRSTDWRVRMAAAENLGVVTGPKENVKLLKRLINDVNPMVRAQAIASMGERGGKDCIPALQKKAGSKNYIIRGYAGAAAASIARREGVDAEGLKVWLRGLIETEETEWVKINHHLSLFILGEKEALPKLMDGLKSEDARVVKAAASCLDRCIELEPSIEADIKDYMQKNFTAGTAEYNSMMAEVMEDELADMLAEEMNKLK